MSGAHDPSPPRRVSREDLPELEKLMKAWMSWEEGKATNGELGHAVSQYLYTAGMRWQFDEGVFESHSYCGTRGVAKPDPSKEKP